MATERFDNLIEEIRKPIKVKYRHVIDIDSCKVFFSMVVIAVTILGMAYVMDNQRETTSQYQNNDLKYRYIKMQRKMSEENIYRLEKQFWYRDSVIIIRKQVEKYEELIREQAEKIERAMHSDKGTGKYWKTLRF